jgi:hypothetical protein
VKPFEAWALPGALPAGATREPLPGYGAELDVHRLRVDGAGAEEIVQRLRDAREALVERPAREIASVLGGVGARFLDPADELRREALELLPPTAGVSPTMARAALDGMAADWRAERLERLLDVELAGGAALDGFVSDRAGRRTRALGLPFTVHVCAGTVPGVSVTSMIRALMVKSAVLLKPGRGDEVLPVLFRRGLVHADSALAAASAVLYWPGGRQEPVEQATLADADLVVVYGGDDAIRGIRGRVPGTTPVVVYPHRVSFGVIGAEAVGGGQADALAGAAARAVALFDQRGCVSPHLFYVLGDGRAAATFAEALAGKLHELEAELPAGALEASSSSAVQQLRGTAELLSASGQGRLWRGVGTSWTVVLGSDGVFEPSCLGRTVRVKPTPTVEALTQAVRPFRRHLQTVGVAGLDAATLSRLADELARLAPTRLTPLESAPWPPPWWHHDGSGPLTSLVRWSDLEERID